MVTPTSLSTVAPQTTHCKYTPGIFARRLLGAQQEVDAVFLGATHQPQENLLGVFLPGTLSYFGSLVPIHS